MRVGRAFLCIALLYTSVDIAGAGDSVQERAVERHYRVETVDDERMERS